MAYTASVTGVVLSGGNLIATIVYTSASDSLSNTYQFTSAADLRTQVKADIQRLNAIDTLSQVATTAVIASVLG